MKLSQVVFVSLLALCVLSVAHAWYQPVGFGFGHHPFFGHSRRLPVRSRLWGFSDPFEDVFRDFEPLMHSMNDAMHQHERLLNALLQDNRQPAALGQAKAGDTAQAQGDIPVTSSTDRASQDESAAPESSSAPEGSSAVSSSPALDALTSWFPAAADFFHGPVVDIQSADKEYVISMDVPGVHAEDIKLELHQDRAGRQVLTVSGERKSESKKRDADGKSSLQSSSYGQFVRSLTLPEHVNVDGISASQQNGVLRVTVPKVEVEPPKKKLIPIRSEPVAKTEL